MSSDTPVDALFRFFSPTIRFPGSGDLGSFRYAPNTSWEAPSLFRGNETIEQAVYREVASPGTQLGVLIDAVLALASQHPALADHEAIGKLQQLGDEVSEKKTQLRSNTEKSLRSELDYLKNSNNEALQTLLRDYLD